MLLVTTPIKDTWGTKEEILFLGQWCILYNDAMPDDRNYSILPYHWDDRQKAADDSVYLQGLNAELLRGIRAVLNDMHGTDYSERSWNLLVGYWLTQFSAVVFDRWTMIRRAVSFSPELETIVLPIDQAMITPNDTEEAGGFFLDDRWNHALYARIIQGWTDIPTTDGGSLRFVPGSMSSRPADDRASAREKGKELIRDILARAGKRNRYFFVRSGLSAVQEAAVSLRLGCVPQVSLIPSLPFIDRDPGMRRWTLPSDASDTDFETALKTLIPEFLPKVFLEGFGNVREMVRGRRLPEKPRVLFTGNSHFCDDLFKVWAVGKLEKGAKLVVGQHGGGAANKYNGGTSYELSVCDIYASSGNANRGYSHLRGVGKFNQQIKLAAWDPNGPAMLVTVAMPRYSFDLRAMPIAGQMLSYFEDQFRFFGSLPEHIREKLLVRIYPKGDYGWNQKQRWLDRFPEVTLDEGQMSMAEQARRCRLFISTYNATTYNESLAANIPTLMYWNPEHWELSELVVQSFEEFKAVGIFHETPESAAEQVMRIWDDVATWWHGSELQEARRRYCKKYAYLPKNIIKPLTDVLRAAG